VLKLVKLSACTIKPCRKSPIGTGHWWVLAGRSCLRSRFPYSEKQRSFSCVVSWSIR